MSGESSNANPPDGLTPEGDPPPLPQASDVAPRPAAPPSRFDAPAPPLSPTSRIDTPAPTQSAASPVASPTAVSAPVPHLMSQSPYANSPGAQYSSAARLAVGQKEVPDLTGGRIAAGIAFGVLAGILSVGAWIGIVAATSFNLALIAVGVGIAIGWAVAKGCGQGGNTVCWIGGVLAFLFTAVGALVTMGTYSAWNIIFSLVCVFYGTRRGFITPAMMDR